MRKESVAEQIKRVRSGQALDDDIWSEIVGHSLSASEWQSLQYYVTLTRNWPVDQLAQLLIDLPQGELQQELRQQPFYSPPTPAHELERLVRALKPINPGRPLIRLGGDEDGGYLIPDDLDGVTHAFSPGVGPTIDFDLDLSARGIQVHFADASVTHLPADHPNYTFVKQSIRSFSDPEEHALTLDDWYKMSPAHEAAGHDDLLLEMDVEGAEYEIINSVSDNLLRRFRIIIVEFHFIHLFGLAYTFPIVSSCFKKLLRSHRVVHIHPNNYSLGTLQFGDVELSSFMEFTFYRKDRCLREDAWDSFPHPLDQDNARFLPPIILPKCWW